MLWCVYTMCITHCLYKHSVYTCGINTTGNMKVSQTNSIH